ncbi:hypothetical protein BOX15_Mlig016516g1 [Macrostomum lignano]|uniref:WD_REPEATS_REGION domain-containing protein n=1 Tax=Macrostomum lignano TaxID=282301 RepID=A0A267GS72_9PLAT|nr:hypothetical protein BOX15_Mlig016516g1 [Macrostomum lignano]
MPQDKRSSSGSRRGRLEDTAKPGAMRKILDEMDTEAKQARRSKSKGGGDKEDKDRDREDRDRDRDRRDSRHKGNDRERSHKDDKERDSKHRDDKDRERRQRDDKDRDRRHKDDKDRDRRREDKDRDRQRDDKDREKRHKDDKDRDRHRDDKDRERRHRDDKDRDRHRDDKDRDRHRDDKDRDRHRDDKDRDRHRDERDRDRRKNKDGDRKSSEQTTKSNGQAETAEAAEDDYNYDDDEFENYDEDFDDFEDDDNEDDDDSDKDRKPPAAAKTDSKDQQRNVPARQQYEDDSEDDYDRHKTSSQQQQQTPRPKAFIDFFGAKRRQANTAAASRTQRRWDELSRLIDLDKVSYDLFQLAPLEEYALYMRQYGRSNAHQAAVQTNEDAIDREAMTDDIEFSTRWTQNPPGDLVECAGVAAANDEDSADEDYDSKDKKKHKKKQTAQLPSKPIQPSAKSLQRTLDLVRRVLEEQSRPRVPNGRREAAGHLSSGFTPLTASSTYGPASRALFDPKRSAKLLTMHPNSSTLLLWNAHEPELPLCVLSAPGGVACACWTPDEFVCAGLDDGALCLWDPTEPAESHGRYDADGVSIRGPTYSTAWSPVGNHLGGGVVGLAAVGRALHSGGAYQLVSMDSSGRLQAWVASTHVGPADPAGSASDLGLRPGGRVSLMRSSRLELPSASAPLPPLCMSAGANGDGAIVGGADGCLIRVNVGAGGSSGSRRCHSICGDFEHRLPASVTAIDASPHGNGLLLIGYADGHVRLMTSSSTSPLLTVQPKSDSIVRLLWSRSRPAVFYSLDSSGRLLVYDLTQKSSGPVSVFAESGVSDFALGEDYHSTGRGSKSDRAVCVLVRANSGEAEVHTLAETLSAAELDEGYRLSQLIDQLCV